MRRMVSIIWRAASASLFCGVLLVGLESRGAETPAAAKAAPPLVSGLKNPESVVIAGGRILVSVIGEFDKDGDGSVISVVEGKAVPLATGLDDPKGMVAWKDWVFVADKTRIWRIDKLGKAEVFSGPGDFPRPPLFLNDLEVDAAGTLYVSDCGNLKGDHGAVYRILPDRSVSVVADHEHMPAIKVPNGLLLDGDKHLLVVDFLSGELLRVALAGGAVDKIAEGFESGDGLVRDLDGNLYVTQWSKGRVSVLAPGSSQPQLVSDKFESSADLTLDWQQGHLLVPDMKAGTLVPLAVRDQRPADVDQTPLAVQIEPAFPQLEFKLPIVLTHGNDSTRRVYVASQLGRISTFADDQDESEPKTLLDLTPRVHFKETENEEGLLGLALHPRFRDNGQFFVYYTTRSAPHMSVISRFTAKDADHAQASLDSEEEILRIPQPFWNHNGGTLAFGPDGMLYIALGDGGAYDDPYGNGQNMNTLLGKILRIDVDHQDAGRKYSIPRDNPFVSRAGCRPEIYASGVRNIWRMSFDREKGTCWAADVGQNIWEEIDLIVPGGNYGWNLREGMHRFTPTGSGPRNDLIEPIWEYHHDIGKSITGGHVYRGKQVPELVGAYLYADYVTGAVWGLWYDEAQRKVLANRPIPGNVTPVMSFGEYEAGEVYFLTSAGHIKRFTSPKQP